MSAAVERTVLPDGLTVLSQTLPDRHTLSLGAWLRTGSRDEPLERLGITHFLEHMMFKGTETRDARAIAASLESLGARSTRSRRASRCATRPARRASICRMPWRWCPISSCRSRFDEAEIEREKGVVREEILS
jgi:predicted Zn-dependent peptidase